MTPLNLFRCMVDFFRLDRWVKRFQKRDETPRDEIPRVELWIGDRIILTHDGEPYAHLYLRTVTRGIHGTVVELRDLAELMEYRRG